MTTKTDFSDYFGYEYAHLLEEFGMPDAVLIETPTECAWAEGSVDTGWNAEEFAWVNPWHEWETRKIGYYRDKYTYFGVWKVEEQK